MLSVLHAALFKGLPIGVVQQMEAEQEAADTLGISWQCRICTASPQEVTSEIVIPLLIKNSARWTPRIARRAIEWLGIRWAFHEWVIDSVKDHDVIVLRYSMHDPFFRLLVRRIKREGKRVYLVHHTKEGDEIRAGGSRLDFLKYVSEMRIAPKTLRCVDGLISVTPEIHAYEVQRAALELSPIIYPNGIKPSGLFVEDRRGAIPEMLFVASNFFPWHGLDIVISQLKKSSLDCRLHLVGRVSKELEEQASHDSRVVIHGVRSQSEIRDISRTCWIALSSFALFRNNMNEACPLKVREYLDMGLPVYSGHRDVFPEEFPYFKHGSASLDEMIGFAMENQFVSRQAVSQAAIPFIDKTSLLNKLYSDIGCLEKQ